MHKILQVVAGALASFLQEQLSSADPKWWENMVVSQLGKSEKKQLKYPDQERLDGLSLSVLLHITLRRWKVLEKRVEFEQGDKDWFSELRRVEERWRTRVVKDIDLAQKYRDSDTVYRVLQVIDADPEVQQQAEFTRQEYLDELSPSSDALWDTHGKQPRFQDGQWAHLRINPELKLEILAWQKRPEGWRYVARIRDGRVLVSEKKLQTKPEGGEKEAFLDWATGVAQGTGLVKLMTLVEQVCGHAPAILGAGQMNLASVVLKSLGFGMVPDPLLGLRQPKRGEKVVVFQLPEGSAKEARHGRDYVYELVNMALGMFVAHADQETDESESQHFSDRIEEHQSLTPHGKARLMANLRWMLELRPDLEDVQERVALADQLVRQSLGKTAIDIAKADGRIDPTEIDAIRQVYTMLELGEEELGTVVQSMEQEMRQEEAEEQFQVTGESPELDLAHRARFKKLQQSLLKRMPRGGNTSVTPEGEPIEVDVYRDGEWVQEGAYPSRTAGRKIEVKYRGKWWPLERGGKIYVTEARATPAPKRDEEELVQEQTAFTSPDQSSGESISEDPGTEAAAEDEHADQDVSQSRTSFVIPEEESVTQVTDPPETPPDTAASAEEEAPEEEAAQEIPADEAVTVEEETHAEQETVAPPQTEETAESTDDVSVSQPEDPASVTGDEPQPSAEEESDEGESSGQTEEWAEARDLTEEKFWGLLDQLRKAKVEVPEVGGEIAGDRMGVVAEAEFAWEHKKVAILHDQEWKRRHYFRIAEWTVFHVDNIDPAEVIAALKKQSPNA